MNETFEEVDGRITVLESREDRLKEQVAKALSANVNSMQGVLNTTLDELTERNNALKD